MYLLDDADEDNQNGPQRPQGSTKEAHVYNQTVCCFPSITAVHRERTASLSSHVNAQTQNSTSLSFPHRIHSHTSVKKQQGLYRRLWRGDEGGGHTAQPTTSHVQFLMRHSGLPSLSWVPLTQTVPRRLPPHSNWPHHFLSPPFQNPSFKLLHFLFCHQLTSARASHPDSSEGSAPTGPSVNRALFSLKALWPPPL